MPAGKLPKRLEARELKFEHFWEENVVPRMPVRRDSCHGLSRLAAAAGTRLDSGSPLRSLCRGLQKLQPGLASASAFVPPLQGLFSALSPDLAHLPALWTDEHLLAAAVSGDSSARARPIEAVCRRCRVAAPSGRLVELASQSLCGPGPERALLPPSAACAATAQQALAWDIAGRHASRARRRTLPHTPRLHVRRGVPAWRWSGGAARPRASARAPTPACR